MAAITIAFLGSIDRVDTQVAMAFGASVHPFTKITPRVKTTMMSSAGFPAMLLIKSDKVIVILLRIPLFSLHDQTFLFDRHTGVFLPYSFYTISSLNRTLLT